MSSSSTTSFKKSSEGGGLTSSFDVQKVLEVPKNVPGEIQDVNYHGGWENNNCDFDSLKVNENNQKDRLHFYQTYRTNDSPAGNLTAKEGQAVCTL